MIIRSNWQAMQAGDPKAGDLILKALGRRARLLGLDAPTVVQHELVTVDSLMDDLDRFLQTQVIDVSEVSG